MNSSFQQKMMQTLLRSNLVKDRHGSMEKLPCNLSHSSQFLSQPFAEPTRVKLPKGRELRRKNNKNMLTQSNEIQRKPSVRTFMNSNHSSIFQNPQQNSIDRSKRVLSPGVFNSLSLESKSTYSTKLRSVQDIGVEKNRKNPGAFKQYNKADPILIGEVTIDKKSKLGVINEQPDHFYKISGQRIKQNLIWQKPKPKTYLQRFRATRKLK